MQDNDFAVCDDMARRLYVMQYGPGVPFFLVGARPRANKDWAWLANARMPLDANDDTSGPSVGRVAYGPTRFYMGDVDTKWRLPHGYGTMVWLAPSRCMMAPGGLSAVAARLHPSDPMPPDDGDGGDSVKTVVCTHQADHPHWEGHAVLSWYEGQWHRGTRCGNGTRVCMAQRAAAQGQWQNDRLHGVGSLVYGKGRWILLPDGSGGGRWSGGDTWRYDGQWRAGERHGCGTVTDLARLGVPHTMRPEETTARVRTTSALLGDRQSGSAWFDMKWDANDGAIQPITCSMGQRVFPLRGLWAKGILAEGVVHASSLD